MKILQRYLAREIYAASALVLLAFLLLFAFFDMVAELQDLGKGSYSLGYAAAYVGLTLPGRSYEIFPIAVLIGALYALTLLAQHSEITVMRASGLSTTGLLWMLAKIGLQFVVLTFVVGEFVAPPADRAAQQLRLQALSSLVGQEFRSGVWVKDESTFVNIRAVRPDTSLLGIRIYEFNADATLKSISEAQEGSFHAPDIWQLKTVVRTRFDADRAYVERFDDVEWKSALSPEILSVLLVVPERMAITHLGTYIRHLRDNQQKTGRYEIAYWKKLAYPFAALVMMALAVPFAFRHHRFGGVSIRVFGGIMIGIFFHMLNGLFSNLGIINDWPPFFSAIAPSMLFTVAAAGMLWWVERR